MSAGRSGPPRAGTGLVGRARELTLISGLIARTAAGQSAAMVFTGEAGVGKSALLDAAARAAAAQGTRVLRGAGQEFEGAVSFSGLRQLLRPLLDELGDGPEGADIALSVALGSQDGPVQAGRQVRNAAISLIEKAAGAGPLLLLFDDLQWADRGTAAVLAALVPDLPGRPVGVLGSCRPGPSLLAAADGTITVTVAPLDASAAATLSTSSYPDMAGTVRNRLVVEAEGNPLALLELPRLLTTGQRMAREPLPAWLPLPHRLQQMYWARISALPEAAQRLVLLVALAPNVSLTVLAPAFTDTPIADVVQTVVRAELGRLEDDRLVLHHPLVSAAVVAASAPESQTSAHRLLGQALAGPDEQLERRAWHLAQAGDEAPRAQAADLLARAATLTYQRGDGAGAMAMLLQSAELTNDPAERNRLLARAAYIGASIDVPRAARIIEDLDLADPGTTNSLEAAVAAAMVFVDGQGDVDMAHRLLTSGISRYANAADPADEILLDAIDVLGWVCWMGGRAGLWADYRAALQRLNPAPPPLVDLGSRTYMDPARTTDRSLQLLDRAVSELATETNPARIIRIAEIAHVYDRIAACTPALNRVVASSARGGSARPGAWALLMIGLDAFHRGRWAITEASVHSARQLIESSGQTVLVWAYQYQLALLAAARGDLVYATQLLDAMARWAIPRRAQTVTAYVNHVETLAAIGRGDFEQAFQYANAISPAGEFTPYAWLAPHVALDLVESAVRTDRPDAARAHVAAMTAQGIARLSPRLEMVSLAGAALVSGPGRATALFERALSIPGGAEWPLDHAHVQLLYGSFLRRNRAIAASRVPLRAALRTFDRLGARPWFGRAQKELAATAEKREAGPEGSQSVRLTPQELEIAELAAGGLPNKKIAEMLAISPRTVGNHLYQVYGKLGIGGRGGLRDALRSPGRGPT